MAAKKYEVIVDSKEKLAESVINVRLKLKDKGFSFRPGQFVVVYHDEKGGTQKREYSIASSPNNKGYIELCVKVLEEGHVSRFLDSAKKGDEFVIEGPYGDFGVAIPPKRDVCLIATGTGIAPMRSILHAILESGTERKVMLFFGFRFETDYLYQAEFEELAEQHDNFVLVATASRTEDPSWDKERGRVNELLRNYLKGDEDMDILLCGNKRMTEDVTKALLDIGFDAKDIQKTGWG